MAITIGGASASDKTVFGKIQRYLDSLPDTIEQTMVAVTIRAVDRYAWEFYQRVLQDAPYQRLRGSIELRRTFKRGRYGYRLLFDGYDEKNTPLQMIANVFSTGRIAGSGVAETGRRYAFGKIEGIQFMSRNLELLKGIDQDIRKNMQIDGWIVSDDKITTNDGTIFSRAEVQKYDEQMNQTA